MKIKYTNKEIQELDFPNVKGKTYIYTISEEDLKRITDAELLEPEDKQRVFAMYKDDSNIIDMLSEDLDNGRILIAGTTENSSLVQFYELEKGTEIILEELLQKIK